MNHKNPSTWFVVRHFFYLEQKKWIRFSASNSYESILFYFLMTGLALTYLNLSFYEPFWAANPRGFAISIVLIITIGFFTLTVFNAIYSLEKSIELFPLNPFAFSFADLNTASLFSVNNLAWALIGWLRAALKSLWFCSLVIMPIVAYCWKYELPLVNVIVILVTFFSVFQTITILGSLCYIIVEEVVEMLKPRWRENHQKYLLAASRIITLSLFLGSFILVGLVLQTSTVFSSSLESIIQTYWYIPPNTIVYCIVALLSRSWSTEALLPAMILLFGICLTVNALYFVIVRKIDPLARLYERNQLISIMNTPNFFTENWISSQLRKVFSVHSIIPNLFSPTTKSLFRKDILCLWKYRFIFGYVIALIFSYSRLLNLLWLDNNLISLIVVSWSYFFVLILWKMENKSIISHYNIVTGSIIKEKWLIMFLFIFPLYLPLCFYSDSVILLLFIFGLHSFFSLGFVLFKLNATTISFSNQ